MTLSLQHRISHPEMPISDTINIQMLYDKLEKVQQDLSANPHSTEMLYTFNTTKAELNKMIETRGAMFRSRMQWHTEGERNTKYFLLEKKPII